MSVAAESGHCVDLIDLSIVGYHFRARAGAGFVCSDLEAAE
jgi:hypothetical protein